MEMKQIIYRIFLVMCFCAVTIGCEDDFENIGEEYYPTDIEYGDSPLGLNSSVGSISGSGGTYLCKVYADEQLSWRITGLPSWLTFSQMQGTGNADITFSAKENPSVSVERSAQFKLESTSESFPIKVTYNARQYMQPKRFTVTPQDVTYMCGPEGGEFVLDIRTNRAWHIQVANEQSNFVSFSTMKDSADCVLTITIPPYAPQEEETRTSTIYFFDDTESYYLYQIEITQISWIISAVDLGLSVKWASCNVGAKKPEEFGGFYGWGEIKERYYNSDYKWYNSRRKITKYCNNSSYGSVDYKTGLDLEDDVAHVTWGGSWRMPTYAEFKELCETCTLVDTIQNGVEGILVQADNGNSIFLPDSKTYGDRGYWTSTLYEGYCYNAYSFSCYYIWTLSYGDGRGNRFCIRPVTD